MSICSVCSKIKIKIKILLKMKNVYLKFNFQSSKFTDCSLLRIHLIINSLFKNTTKIIYFKI